MNYVLYSIRLSEQSEINDVRPSPKKNLLGESLTWYGNIYEILNGTR